MGVALEQPHGACQVDRPLLIDHLHTGVSLFVSAIDVNRLVGFVVGVFLFEFQHAHKAPGGVI